MAQKDLRHRQQQHGRECDHQQEILTLASQAQRA
jgi:hypothetical protein